MNARGIFCSIIIAFVFVLHTGGNAQQASAEFISSFMPAKLESGQQVKDGIQNLFYKNNRLYVTDVWAGLQILDVVNVKQPKELGTFPTGHRTHNVFIQDDYAYMSNELDGVSVLDISNPTSIIEVAKIDTKGDAYWVVADYPYIYVAEEKNGISIYSIRDIDHPHFVTTYDTPGWAWGLYLDGSTLYIADKSGGLITLDVSNALNPVKLGQYNKMKYVKTVQVENGIAYVANGPEGLWILDVSNPKFPALISKLSIDGFIYNAFKAGNSVFLANELRKRLEIIDVTDLKKPVKEGDYQADGKVYAAWKHDVYVYVAADIHTLILRHNKPPVLAKIDNKTVNENENLTVFPKAYDPDGDQFIFTVENLPDSAKFDTLSGMLSWTPTYEQSGLYPGIIITAVEKTATQLQTSAKFDINVKHVNRGPSIPDVEDQEINENNMLTFNVQEGSDPDIEDKGLLTYTAENMPEGASFNPKKRVFNWTPTYEQSGVYAIDFAVHDPAGELMPDAAVITVYHVDRKPTLNPVDPQSVDENNLLTFTISGSDPDGEDQNVLSYEAQNLPDGAVFNAADAAFSWTPNYDQSGVYKGILFKFTAGALSDSILFDITVNHVNRPPVLETIANQTVDENNLLTYSITGSDPDVEDQGKLQYTVENLPQGAVFNPDSLIVTWMPTFEQSGSFENITFKVQDPPGLSDSKSMNITAAHINRLPVLANIGLKTVDENVPLTFDLSGSDPDREDEGKLTYSVEGLPDGAVLEGTSFSWTPTYDQSGSYHLSFTVSDGRLTDTKETDITVNHVNRNPAIADITAQTVNENELLSFAIAGSDPDVEDEGKWILSAVNLPEGAVFDAAMGKFDWTPTYEQSGAYTIKFINTDPSGLTAEKEVGVTANHINRTPVFSEQASQVVDENTALVFNLVPASDSDVEDEGKIVYTAADLPEGAQFDADNLTLSWTPTYDQSGEYTVAFSVADGEFTVAQPLKITVNHINRPPELAPPSDQTIDENSPWTLKVEFSDPDNEDAGKVVLSAGNLPEGAVFDAAAGMFSWTATYDQSGAYSGITITATDGGGLTDEKSFNITVNNVNRTPGLEPIAALEGVENTPLTISLQASDPDREDEGKLTFSAEGLPEGAVFDSQTGIFTWTPTFEQSGMYENITFTVKDLLGLTETKSINIPVAHVNRVSVLADIGLKTVDENVLLTFDLSGSDPDREDEGKLTYSVEGLPDGAVLEGMSFSWTATYDQSGSYHLSFTVSDGRLTDTKETDITVNHVNRNPAIADITAQTVNENELLGFAVAGSDPDVEDEGEWILSAVNLPEGAVFDAAAGMFSWTPTYEQSGAYTIKFINTDPSGLTAEKEVGVTANHINRTPVFSEQASQVVDENTALVFNLVPASDSDVEDEGKIVYTAADLPEGAQFDADNLTLSWTPTYDQSGEYTVAFSVADGEFTVAQPLKITVNHINRPPELVPPSDQTIDENSPWTLKVEFSDPDKEDAGKVILSAGNLPEGAVFDAAAGMFSWTATYDQSGAYSGITITATDGGGLTDEKSFNITVNNVNRTPGLEAIAALEGVENTPLTISLQASDPDKEDEGKLTFSAEGLPEGAVFDSQTGIMNWQPNFLQAGASTVNFKVTDTGNLSAEQSVVITIGDLNHAPVLNETAAQTVKESEELKLTVTGSDEDTDNTLTYSAESLPDGASFDPVNQLFSWTPGFEQAGAYSATFKLSDGKEEVSTTVQITVGNINRSPKFVDLEDKEIVEDNELKFKVNAGDDDAGAQLTYSAEGLPEGASFNIADQTFSWKPNFEQAGTHTAVFKVSDGTDEAVKTITITVKNFNHAPKISEVPDQVIDESKAFYFKVEASDEDSGTELSYSASDLPEGAKFDPATQTFRWKPGYDQAGEHTVKINITDGEETVTKAVKITVKNVNREPKINGSRTKNIEAGSALNFKYSVEDPDTDDSFTFKGSNLPSGASIDSKSGEFSWTPAENQIGDHTITVSVSDGEAEDSMETKITVRKKRVTTEAQPDSTNR